MNKKTQLSQRFAKFMIIFICFSCSLPTFSSSKEYLQLWRGVHTYHVDRANDEADFEQNQITAIFYRRWIFGTFINSYSRRSDLLAYNVFYRGYDHTNLHWHYGMSVAAATGYGRELATNIDGRITIGISPFIGVKYHISNKWAVGIDSMYLPTDNGGVFVSGLNINYRLD